jgi:hypothetical protein
MLPQGHVRRWSLAVATVVVGASLIHAAPAYAATPPGPQTPAANPLVPNSCGTNVVLQLDASGSINSSGAVADVRNAAEAFLDALADTGSTARVLQFASYSEQLAGQAEVTTTSLLAGGAFRTALNRYYNPIPPRPSGTNIYRYRGSGDPQLASRWELRNSDNQYTNWDQSLDQAGQPQAEPIELIVYVTDGDPTAYDFNQSGDPFDAGPPPDVGTNTNRGDANATTLDRAVQEANQAKAAGARILAVGVGNAVTGSTASVGRLVQIAGPQVIDDSDLGTIDSINDVDVALVRDFDALAQFLRSVVSELCSPSLSIRKVAQSADDAEYQPAEGWSITVDPTVDGGSYEWILPDTDPAQSARCGDPTDPNDGAPRTCSTDSTGLANFQWEPAPSDAATSAVVTEEVRAGFTPGRPGEPDWTCRLKNDDGTEEVLSGDFTDPTSPEFTLDVDPDQIITCTIFNSFDYEPAIAVSKVDDPTVVRGDLTPPATVTSTFEVTNPGNTPLTAVSVADDRCVPTSVDSGGTNVGDVAPANGALDPGETWIFRCVRSIQTPDSTDPAGVTIVNTARAAGTDPAGTRVVSNEASAEVTAFNPAVAVTKLVNGADSVTVPAGTEVTYTYRVSNAGNTPLSPVTLADDTAPCGSPTRGPDDPGNDDDTLGLTEVWTYTCDAIPTGAVTNTATATGTPLDPTTSAPFPDPNPVVTDTDIASVAIVNPSIELTKAATPPVVLLDEAGNPESVLYSFVADNTGDVPLGRPGSPPGPGPKAPGWIVDARCTSAATYASGDTNDNDRLDSDEQWTFTCPGSVSAPTVNLAQITAQPLDPATFVPVGATVTDRAVAFVDVLRPGIAIAKQTLTPVVVDPAAVTPPDVSVPDGRIVAGPDHPTPRPAEYVYEVTNTGNVSLDLDPDPPVDDLCSPLVLLSGDDAPSNGLLEPGEVWTYTCSTTLTRDDANTPPVTGDESGLVQNDVVVRGVPVFLGEPVPDKAVTATDVAQVLVTEPGISLTKTASADVVVAGSEVTYTIALTNTGDVGLDVIGPIDDSCFPLVFVGGDRPPANGILDGANSGSPETWTYTCTRTVGLPVPPAVDDVNTAGVLAVDPLGNVLAAVDAATVRVFDPAIALTKTARRTLVPRGTPVTYDFVVSNVGLSPLPADDVLAEIELVDLASPAQPSCSNPTYVSGDDGDGLLQRDEVWDYVCTSVVTASTTDIATVTGVGGTLFEPPLPVEVSATATAFVKVFNPAIQVDKTADPTQLPAGGGPVTYRYEVRNTGDVPLAGVKRRIVDDRCSPVTYVSGDLDGDDLLDAPNSIFEDSADEVWIFTCTTTLTQTTVNTVRVTGTPTDPAGDRLCGVATGTGPSSPPCDVTDSDTARVTVAASPVQPPLPPPPPPPLPETGAGSAQPLLALGVVVTLVGGALVGTSRIRRRHGARRARSLG